MFAVHEYDISRANPPGVGIEIGTSGQINSGSVSIARAVCKQPQANRINMIFADHSRLRISSADFQRPLARRTLGVIALATLVSACASKQPDALNAGDEYWEQVRTGDLQVVTGNPGDNSIVLEDATFRPAQQASRNTTSQKQKSLRTLAENSVRADNPGAYTVAHGDTLWDISERFLSRPWLWPEIWHVNPQIGNPHLIFPGDQISLTYVDGKPRLQLSRGGVQTIPAASKPISTFPLDAIEEFLVKPRVVTAAQLKAAPYVVSGEDDRLISAAGDKIYVRGTESDGNSARYNVYRPGKALVDPDNREVLGHEAVLVSTARMVRAGDPSTLLLTSNTRETLVGDRMMTADELAFPENFRPKPSALETSGKIISVFDSITRSGQNQVVVLNLGEADGVTPGDVMAVISNDRQVRDQISGKKNDWVTIPGDQSGVVMVFRTFDRVSYALIMEANRAVKIYDRVASTL